jgi:hypothetical protein
VPAPILSDLPSPAPAATRAGDQLTVLVVARSELHGRRFAQSVERLGHHGAGPVLGSDADRLEHLHRPDLCLIELPLDRPQPVFLLVPELRDRRETRGLGVRLAAPVPDEQLAAAILLARTRAAELRAVEREASDPAAVIRDLDAIVHAKAVLRDRLATSEPHASHLLQRAAARRGDRLADCARRVWALRATLAPAIG